MFKLVVLTDSVVAEGAEEDATTVVPNAPFTFTTNGFGTWTRTKIKKQMLNLDFIYGQKLLIFLTDLDKLGFRLELQLGLELDSTNSRQEL